MDSSSKERSIGHYNGENYNNRLASVFYRDLAQRISDNLLYFVDGKLKTRVKTNSEIQNGSSCELKLVDYNFSPEFNLDIEEDRPITNKTPITLGKSELPSCQQLSTGPLLNNIDSQLTSGTVYICNVCGLCLPSISVFDEHEINNHPNVFCNFIEYQINRNIPTTLLRWHNTSPNGLLKTCKVPQIPSSSVIDQPNIKCTKCNCKFSTTSDLYEHILNCTITKLSPSPSSPLSSSNNATNSLPPNSSIVLSNSLNTKTKSSKEPTLPSNQSSNTLPLQLSSVPCNYLSSQSLQTANNFPSYNTRFSRTEKKVKKEIAQQQKQQRVDNAKKKKKKETKQVKEKKSKNDNDNLGSNIDKKTIEENDAVIRTEKDDNNNDCLIHPEKMNERKSKKGTNKRKQQISKQYNYSNCLTNLEKLKSIKKYKVSYCSEISLRQKRASPSSYQILTNSFFNEKVRKKLAARIIERKRERQKKFKETEQKNQHDKKQHISTRRITRQFNKSTMLTKNDKKIDKINNQQNKLQSVINFNKTKTYEEKISHIKHLGGETYSRSKGRCPNCYRVFKYMGNFKKHIKSGCSSNLNKPETSSYFSDANNNNEVIAEKTHISQIYEESESVDSVNNSTSNINSELSKAKATDEKKNSTRITNETATTAANINKDKVDLWKVKEEYPQYAFKGSPAQHHCCPYCKRGFTYLANFRRHTQSDCPVKHKDDNANSNKLINILNESKIALEESEKVTTKINESSPNQKQKKAQNHRTIQTDIITKSSTCIVPLNDVDIKENNFENNSKAIKIFTCSVCDKVYSSHLQILKHRLSHKLSGSSSDSSDNTTAEDIEKTNNSKENQLVHGLGSIIVCVDQATQTEEIDMLFFSDSEVLSESEPSPQMTNIL